VQIEQVDAQDDVAFAGWFAVLDAWQREGRPEEPGWLLEEQRALVLCGSQDDPDERTVAMSAVEDGQVLGIARVDLPCRDNLHLADLLLITHPAHRRRGIARALLADVERRVREQGRTTIVAISDEPRGQEGRSPSRFAGPALGFSAEQVEVRRDIDLPLSPAVVTGLEELAATHAAGYDLRTWRDAVPDDLLEDQAHLLRRMSTDVPTAGLDWQEEEWDAARVRRSEQQARDMGRTWFGAGAVHRDSGRLVAYTTMGVPIASPQRAYQWDTLVLREHRGHRLGTLVKLACLRRLSREVPEAGVISTWNAQENTPMIRVNDALGARTNGQLVNWQKRL
jgi:GNAT superfamily N-acetyltransferase